MCCNRNDNERNEQNCLMHVHEVEGPTQIGGKRNCLHFHCFCTTTSKGIPCGNCNHFHEVEFVTDIVDCHCHKFCGRTGPAIQTSNGEHIHLIESVTCYNDGHRHCIKIATGIEEPIRC